MKKIKDPVYGYIELEDLFVSVIDTPFFQRLRDIIQTSYSALYPSSMHNRFAHSVGVFYLGNIAYEYLCKNSNVSEELRALYREKFLLACLCHDIGHSPFSHTGEKFYANSDNSDKLNKLVNNSTYSSDLSKKRGLVGKEHEVMSALLGLMKFKSDIGKDYYDFFARCIIGLKYTDKKDNSEIKFKNACIELLNGSIIDVDKLDYILRDSYMAGYENALIDYKRLLSGVMIDQSSNPDAYIAYKKSSLSVLESVLNAHDLERRWIQSHPSVVYDSYLLSSVIKDVNEQFSENKMNLFSIEALTEKGINLNNKNSIRFLSDSDIKFLSKQIYSSSFPTQEYFCRKNRRHPIWKSEAEFNAFVKPIVTDGNIEIINDLISRQSAPTHSINNDFLKKLKSDMKAIEGDSEFKKDVTLIKKLDIFDKEVKLITDLKSYLISKDIKFDIVILNQQQFHRNLSKSSFKDLNIYFENYDRYIKMEELCSCFPDEKDDKNIFYIYYKYDGKKLNCKDFCDNFRSFLTKLG